jgi:hypothetical protein
LLLLAGSILILLPSWDNVAFEMPQTRIYANKAEKQKAYRQRLAEGLNKQQEMNATAREIAALARRVGVARPKAPDWEALEKVAAMLSGYIETRANCD